MARHTETAATPRLGLDKQNGWICGVCAGLANFISVDPAIVRVAVIVGALFLSKFVIAGYLLAWLLLDDRPLRRTERDGRYDPPWRR